MFTFADAVAAEVVEATTPFGPLVVVPDDRVPLGWMRMAFPVGKYDVPEVGVDPEVLWRAAVLMALADAEVDATITPWMTADACGVDAVFLVTDTKDVARHLYRIAVEDYDGIDVPSLLLRSEWRRQRHLPEHQLNAAVAEVFYRPNDPRRREWGPPWGSLDGAKLEWLRDRVFADPGATFGAAGALEPAQAQELLATVFAHPDAFPEPWRLESAVHPLVPAERWPADVVVRADGREQVLVAWARPGIAATDPLAAAAILADEVLREGVEEVAREVRGDVYAVETSGMVGVSPGAWVLATGTAPERVPGLVEAVEAWLDGVGRDGLPADAIAAARIRLEGTARGSESPLDVLAREVDRRVHMQRPGARELLDQTRSVPAEEVDGYARAFCASGERVRFRVLPQGVDDPMGK